MSDVLDKLLLLAMHLADNKAREAHAASCPNPACPCKKCKCCGRTVVDHIFEKSGNRLIAYRDDKQDFGVASDEREFAGDWKRVFQEEPPAKALELFRQMREKIYGKGRKCGRCG